MSETAEPLGGAADVVGPEVEQPPDAQAQRHVQAGQIFVNPPFLERVSHPNQEHVGPGGVDLVDDGPIQPGVGQVAVVIAG